LSTVLPGEGAWTAGGREFNGFEAYLSVLALLDRDDIAALALTLGILCFAVVSAILFVRTRRHLAEVEAAARDEALASKAAIDRAYALLLSEPQILIAWPPAADEPEIIGDPALVTTAGAGLLDFGAWLEADAARDMQHSIDALRARGVSFAITVATLDGRIIEAKGQVIGGRAILRMREVSGAKQELAELARRYQKHVDDSAAIHALIATIPAPVWARDEAGKLSFANQAYARAVEAKDGAEAIERGVELFEHGGRSELLRAHGAVEPYCGRLSAVVAGERRSFDVTTVPAARGSAGIAADAT
jgi:PAS domain-containing protein